MQIEIDDRIIFTNRERFESFFILIVCRRTLSCDFRSSSEQQYWLGLFSMTKYKKEEIQAFINPKDPLVEFIKPKQTPKSSPLWIFFHQIFYNKVKQDFIQCDTCQAILVHKSITGTKVMSTHKRACTGISQSDAKQQRHLEAFFPSKAVGRKIPPHIKNAILTACVEFAALDNRSFETTNGNGFINLIEQVFIAGQRLSTLHSLEMTQLLPGPQTVNEDVSSIEA